MGVSLTTAKSYVRDAFDRLGLAEPNPRVQLAVRVERSLTETLLLNRGFPQDCVNTLAMRYSA
jgi:hypothetical protein